MERTVAVQLVCGLMNEVVDGARYERFDRYFDPDFVDHTPLGDAVGKDAWVAFLDGFRAALPDFRHEVGDVNVITDDLITWRVRVRATFTGTFMGQPGSGQTIDVHVVNAARVRGGRVVEHWSLGPESLAEMLSQMQVQMPVPV